MYTVLVYNNIIMDMITCISEIYTLKIGVEN